MTQNDKVAKGFNELLNQFTPDEPQESSIIALRDVQGFFNLNILLLKLVFPLAVVIHCTHIS